MVRAKARPRQTLVLCVLEVLGRDSTRTARYQDSIVVRVERSDDILNAVNREVHRLIREGRWFTGLKPAEWTVTSYQTESGTAHF